MTLQRSVFRLHCINTVWEEKVESDLLGPGKAGPLASVLRQIFRKLFFGDSEGSCFGEEKKKNTSTSSVSSTCWILEVPRATFSNNVDSKDQSIGLRTQISKTWSYSMTWAIRRKWKDPGDRDLHMGKDGRWRQCTRRPSLASSRGPATEGVRWPLGKAGKGSKYGTWEAMASASRYTTEI